MKPFERNPETRMMTVVRYQKDRRLIWPKSASVESHTRTANDPTYSSLDKSLVLRYSRPEVMLGQPKHELSRKSCRQQASFVLYVS